MAAPEQPQLISRRSRSRGTMRSKRRTKIARRVIDFYKRDQEARSMDRAERMQRYAKFRQWTRGNDWPWPDASDLPSPDITSSVLRTEDTLHNAVMANRPAVVSRALHEPDAEKQTTLDDLQDFQLFVEQPGEQIISDLADQFTKEGSFTAFIPWVRETRRVDEVRRFEAIPDEATDVESLLRTLVLKALPGATFTPAGDLDGWDWDVTFPEEPDRSPARAAFYTDENGELELVIRQDVETFDGPRVFVKSYDQVVTPPRVANLQIPGPSNPNGAPHVVLMDRPTIDEVRRLQRSGFYDLMKKSEADELRSDMNDYDDDEERQKDQIRGQDSDDLDDPSQDDHSGHQRVTRLLCFDIYDLDNDGRTEDVVFWVILETAQLVRARHLTEVYPSNPPRRPFAEAQFLPIKDRRDGIGLIELLEPLADWKKVTADMMMDSGQLTNTPFFFYRPSSGLNPEVFRPGPGDGIPTNDPKNDIEFPRFNNSTQAWAINLMAIIQQMQERLDLIGDLNLGRVPAGKASALRTASGIGQILSQSEARPERILRRFFMGLVEIYKQMHELNQRYLRPGKVFRVAGVLDEGQDPYRKVESSESVRGRFQFDFDANVLNSSKQALQQSLQLLAEVYLSEIGVQTGIVGPEQVYRLFRDIGRAAGQKPDKYLQPPNPDSMLPPMNAAQALFAISRGVTEFRWQPMEGARIHLDRIIEFIKDPNMDAELEAMGPEVRETLKRYMAETAQLADAQEKQQAMAQAAVQAGPGGTSGGGGGPPVDQSFGPVGENELLQEELPTAGGGGAPF